MFSENPTGNHKIRLLQHLLLCENAAPHVAALGRADKSEDVTIPRNSGVVLLKYRREEKGEEDVSR